MHDKDRREALKTGGALLALGMLGGVSALPAFAQEGHMKGAKRVPAVVVSASREKVCATCRFWGGIRRASEDKKIVNCESLGWCNNPDSPNYQTMTTPETGPMDAWRKWEAI
jgi:anaerobic selenocysteine-containing dehydrogenase